MSTTQACSHIVVEDKKHYILIQDTAATVKIPNSQYKKNVSYKVHNIVIPGTAKVELSIGCG